MAVVIPFESQPHATIEKLVALVAADMKRVNAAILSRTGSQVTMIPEVANHLISSGGKRLRPMLTIAMAALADYAGDGHIRLAAAVEFMHTATLLHDDVVDESEMRRGKLAARMLWGNEASVLVGDFLYSRSFQLMVELESMTVQKILADTTNRIAEGEVLQLLHVRNPDTDEATYLRVIERKTAILFAAATRLGALLAGADAATQEALHAYGLNLGYAFQIADDVLDYASDATTLGKNLGDDLAEGKMTLPLIHAMAHSDATTRARLREIVEHGDLDGLATVQAAIARCDSLTYSRQRALEYADAAIAALSTLPDNAHSAALRGLAHYSVNRDH